MSNNPYFHVREALTQAGDEERAEAGVLTLCMDTATDRRSVALTRGETILALRARGLRDAGASSILRELDEVLREAGEGLRGVGLLAVCTGPGSFTGLRAGLATVKALSKTLGKPVVGVPTLHAIAFEARPARRLYALLPAGRGEVFAQLLSAGVDGSVSELTGPEHLPPSRLLEKACALGGGLKWAGGGAVKYLEQIAEAASAAGLSFSSGSEGRVEPRDDEWMYAETPEALAPAVAALALAAYREGRTAAAEELRAIYVRPSDAELNEQCHAQS